MDVTKFIADLNLIYPHKRLLTQQAQLAVYQSDALTSFQVRPIAVVLPETQDEVIQTVCACHKYEVPFVARGSGTSLSGGSLPILEETYYNPILIDRPLSTT